MSIIETNSFMDQIGLEIQPHRENTDTQQRALKISIGVAVKAVTDVFNATEAGLFKVPRGRGQDNRARSAALYLFRKAAAKPLGEIAEVFGLALYGSASGMISGFAKRIQQDESLDETVIKVEKTTKVQIAYLLRCCGSVAACLTTKSGSLIATICVDFQSIRAKLGVRFRNTGLDAVEC